MCGIAGSIAHQKSFDSGVMHDRVLAMLKSMPWRGPDAIGMWNSNEVVFGHLRLSIIDLSERSNQPMVAPDGCVITFNGEIYNYKELKAELDGLYPFRTESDTEVILAAYARWGTDCVRRFNGEWAFAIYDPNKNIVFISRDRFGIKPLYIHNDSGVLLFCSEVRGLLAAGVPPDMPVERIVECLQFRQIESRKSTLIGRIEPVEPGTSLEIDLASGRIHTISYYGPTDLFGRSVPEDIKAASLEFGELLVDAVRLRLRADVPVQVMLSGGLDSSAIAGICERVLDERISTLSYVSPGSAEDESYYSDMVANYLKTNHCRVSAATSDFFSEFDRVIIAQDFPSFSEKHVPRFALYSEASRKSKVVIEGQGGDEVFGGYQAMYRLYREKYEDSVGVKLVMDLPKSEESSRYPAHTMISKAGKRRAASKNEGARLLGPVDSYRNKQYSILSNSLPSLLHTGDRLQMYNSIEGRYPFLDHRVVEFGFSSPVHFKMNRYDKYLLRSYSMNKSLLPDSVILRTDKKGFSTGFERYLLTSKVARDHFQNAAYQLCEYCRDVFDEKVIGNILNEQYTYGVNNLKKLLSVYALNQYLRNNRVSIV